MRRAIAAAFGVCFLACTSAFGQIRGLTGGYEMHDPIEKGSTVQVTLVLKLANRTNEHLTGANVVIANRQPGAPALGQWFAVSLPPGRCEVLKTFVDFPVLEYKTILAGGNPDIKALDLNAKGQSRSRPVELLKGLRSERNCD